LLEEYERFLLQGLEVQMARHSHQSGNDGSPLALAAQTFQMLTAVAPDGLRLEHPGAASGSLSDLQAAMLEPGLTCAARDELWRVLAARVRTGDASWTVACVGLAAPRLSKVVGYLTGGCAADRLDVEAVVISAFVDAVRTIGLHQPHVEQRLLWAAHRAGAWHLYAARMPSAAEERQPIPAVRFGAVVPDQNAIGHIFI
jgi:hypothetical protein